MRKLTIFQQELWERYRRSIEGEIAAREEVDRQKDLIYSEMRAAKMYADLLEREGIDVVKRQAALDAAEQAEKTEETPQPQTNGFNKTHAIIDVFQRFGDAGFGPTELWQKAVEVYPDRDISRNYVNSVVGKLQAPPRELLNKNGNGKYKLTEKGQKFVVEVGT